MALGVGDVLAIVFGIYSLLVTLLAVAMFIFFRRKQKKKFYREANLSRPASQSQHQEGVKSRSSSRQYQVDIESQTQVPHELEISREDLEFVTVDLQEDDFQRQESYAEQSIHRPVVFRSNVDDASSFETVDSSDEKFNERQQTKTKTKRNRKNSDNLEPGDFGSVKSESDSIDTVYSDVITATPKVKRLGHEYRPSVSSTLSHEFFDVQEFDLPGPQVDGISVIKRQESSSSEITKKKKPAPKPPLPILTKKTDSAGTDSSVGHSSSSSDDESPQLRRKDNLERDMETVRRSYQAAPDKYRKESSYLHVSEENLLEGSDPKMEIVLETVSNKNSNSSTLTDSTTESVIEKKPADDESDFSSPKFFPRKSSFSSPSDVEIRNSTRDRVRSASSSSSSSESEGSFHIEEDDFVENATNILHPKLETDASDSFSNKSESSPVKEAPILARRETVESELSDEEVVENVRLENQEREVSENEQSSSSSSSDSEEDVADVKFEVIDVRDDPEVDLAKRFIRLDGDLTPQSSSDDDVVDVKPCVKVEVFESSSESSDEGLHSNLDRLKTDLIVNHSIETFVPQRFSTSKDSTISEETSLYGSDDESRKMVRTRPVTNLNEIQSSVEISRGDSSDSSTSDSHDSLEEDDKLQKKSSLSEKSPTIRKLVRQSSNEISSSEEEIDPKSSNNFVTIIAVHDNELDSMSLHSPVDEVDIHHPDMECVTEIMIADEPDVRESDDSDSSSSSRSKSASPTGNPRLARKIEHASTLPADISFVRRRSSSSSSLSSSDVTNNRKLRRGWSTSFLQKLNRDYEPVYKLRMVTSTTQTDQIAA